MTEPHPVEWAPVAIDDLNQILDFVSVRGGRTAAKKLCARIINHVESLANLPMGGRVVPELRAVGVDVYRELILPPYRIFYRATDDSVGIIGVLDSRRDIEESLLARIVTGTVDSRR